MNSQPNPRLIHDVGLFGIERARVRFSAEIEAKRITVLNTGVAPMLGMANFWVSDEELWNSFDRQVSASAGDERRTVTIHCVPYAAYGTPEYPKVDIEGCDHLCVEAAAGLPLQHHISVESECASENTEFADEQAIWMRTLLRESGYRRSQGGNKV